MSTLKSYLTENLNSSKTEMIDENHFFDFRQNIFGGTMDENFIKMFLNGDGNELVSKACAVHSSSMLGYNFFHWISKNNPLTLKFEDKTIEYTKVLFEVKIPVLKRSRSANMDIVLTNDNNDILFIESKFLEYLNLGKFDISDTYKREGAYYCNGKNWCTFISSLKTSEKKQYWGGIKQEICHLIGLTNWINEKTTIEDVKFDKGKDIRFINLVFEPNEQYEEHEDFKKYRNLYYHLHEELQNYHLHEEPQKKGLIPDDIKMSFKSYSDLWSDISDCVSEELKAYLYNRYMNFAKND